VLLLLVLGNLLHDLHELGHDLENVNNGLEKPARELYSLYFFLRQIQIIYIVTVKNLSRFITIGISRKSGKWF
jgi:hypothetical protein